MCQQLASYVLAVVHYNHKHHAATAVILSGCVSLHIVWYIAMFLGAHCKQLETKVLRCAKIDLEDEIDFTTCRLKLSEVARF